MLLPLRTLSTGVAVALLLTLLLACSVPPGKGAAPPAARAVSGGYLSGAVVVVDAGHPSENGDGAVSRRGTVESHVTLAIARRLESLLRERGATVVMTRTELNQVVTNRERAEIANRARAHVMVRLHCDDRAASGTATYYPDRTGTTPDGVTGPSDDVIARSAALARAFHPALVSAMGPGWGDVGVLGESRTGVGARQGALTGSIHSRVPTVTVEMVSLHNERDDLFITTAAGEDRMARALLAGIEAYLFSPASGFR